MINPENPFFKHSLSKDDVDRDPSSRTARFREDVTYSLQNGIPLLLEKPTPNGDRMIRFWAAHMLLKRYAKQKGIGDPNLNLKYEGEGLFLEKNAQAIATNVLNSTPPPEANAYWISLVQLGASLGVELTTDDFLAVPQPLRTELKPFDKIDRQRIVTIGEKLRTERLSSGESITVIAQAGSNPTKRFTDEQTLRIADAVSVFDPKTHLVVVSDKKILKAQLEPQIEMRRQIAKGERQGGYIVDNRGFPLSDKSFLKSLSTNPYSEVAESVVIEDDINTVSAQFFAADRIIAPDGFWAWLGAGGNAMRTNGKLNKDSLFVLYTIASARKWGIPGAVSVESGALGLERTRGALNNAAMIDPLSYVDSTTKDYDKKPIADYDINLLIETYRRKVHKFN